MMGWGLRPVVLPPSATVQASHPRTSGSSPGVNHVPDGAHSPARLGAPGPSAAGRAQLCP